MLHSPQFYLFLSALIVCFTSLPSCISEIGSADPDEFEDPYGFFVAGHLYGQPSVFRRGVHPPFLGKSALIINDSLIRFGVLTGDFVRKASAENFNAFEADMKWFEHPIYIAAGNHDLSDRSLFENRYGPTYYSFQHNSDIFIILDSNLDGWNISGDQLVFLEEILNDKIPSTRNIFVFVHHLIWWSRDNDFHQVRINSSTGRADSTNFFSSVLPLFTVLDKPVYFFAGDVGAQPVGSEFMYYQEDNIFFIASGMGGGERDNFLIVTVTDEVQIRLVAINGDDPDALGRLEDYVLPGG